MIPVRELSWVSPEVESDWSAAFHPHLLPHGLRRVEPSRRVWCMPCRQNHSSLAEDQPEVLPLRQLEVLEHQGQQILPLGLLVEGEPVRGVVEEDNSGGEVSEGGRGGGVTISSHFVHTRLSKRMAMKIKMRKTVKNLDAGGGDAPAVHPLDDVVHLLQPMLLKAVEAIRWWTGA